MDALITRFRRTAGGELVLRNGQPLLEFIAIYRPGDHMWAIPGAFVLPGETATPDLAVQKLRNEALKMVTNFNTIKEAVVKCFVGKIRAVRWAGGAL